MMSAGMTNNEESDTEKILITEDSNMPVLICDNCEESLNDAETYQCKTCNSQKDVGMRS